MVRKKLPDFVGWGSSWICNKCKTVATLTQKGMCSKCTNPARYTAPTPSPKTWTRCEDCGVKMKSKPINKCWGCKKGIKPEDDKPTKKQKIKAWKAKKRSGVSPQSFYESDEWRALRYQALKLYGRKCLVCFRTDVEIHVDHIKPRSKFPELSLVLSNLQILCRDCNLGKSNRDETDWRTVR